MAQPALEQLIDFLSEVIAICRASASLDAVPGFARERLTDAADNVEFFLSRGAYRRAMHEARFATAIHAAVERFLHAAVDATGTLRLELGED